MSSVLKRSVVAGLFLLFVIFTFLVDTVGTDQDQGSAWLSDSAKSGKLLFQKYNCTACHQLYGLGGYMGPDLTNVISRPGKGADYCRAFLSGGTNGMPDFKLNHKELNELIAYLTYIDKTGISPVKKFEINPNGTVSINEN
jgi:nitric oxide reductase subunit C